jgi:hypothetical protein
MNKEPERELSKRGRAGEGRPTKRTPEVVAKIAEAIASGLTDREAGLLAGIRHDTMTEWRKDPEFSEAIEKATAERLLTRLERWLNRFLVTPRMHGIHHSQVRRETNSNYDVVFSRSRQM